VHPRRCGVGSIAALAPVWTPLDAWVPDVLVSDIAMPGEDGCTLMRRIRASVVQ